MEYTNRATLEPKRMDHTTHIIQHEIDLCGMLIFRAYTDIDPHRATREY